MKHKYIPILLIALLSLAFVACQPPEPEPEPESEEPPEPSPEQYYQQIKNTLGSLLTPGTPAPPDNVIQEAISQVQLRRQQLSMTENGRAAIQMISRDVDESIRETRREGRWKKVKALCVLHTALQPGNERHASLLEHADLMLGCPRITITGFLELDGEIYAFLDLFDPKTGETTPYRRREGEEFHDVMRIVRIVGNQQSVEVEYLPARHVWTVPGPRERARSGA